MPDWTFLTNHAHVMISLARDPGMRVRDVAAQIGITERAAQRILNDLVGAGYVTRRRVGARNQYELHPELPLRHPLHRHHTVGELLAALTAASKADRGRAG